MKKSFVKLYDLEPRVGIHITYEALDLIFDHIDGVYSHCIVAEGKSKGEPFHLSASTPLKRINSKHYEVAI